MGKDMSWLIGVGINLVSSRMQQKHAQHVPCHC